GPVDAARHPHAIAPLELLEPGLRPLIEGGAEVVGASCGRQIALDDQAPADVGDALVLVSRQYCAPRGDLVPAAPGYDVLIARDGLVHLPQHGLAAPGGCVRPELFRLERQAS